MARMTKKQASAQRVQTAAKEYDRSPRTDADWLKLRSVVRNKRLNAALDAYYRTPKKTPESSKAWAAVMAEFRSEAYEEDPI
jgi:hypothetical protein